MYSSSGSLTSSLDFFHHFSISLTDLHPVAVADFDVDEVVFSIPRTAVLNTQNLPADSVTALTPESLAQMPNWLVGSSSFRKATLLKF